MHILSDVSERLFLIGTQSSLQKTSRSFPRPYEAGMQVVKL